MGAASAAAAAGAEAFALTPCALSRAEMEAAFAVYYARVPEASLLPPMRVDFAFPDVLFGNESGLFDSKKCVVLLPLYLVKKKMFEKKSEKDTCEN